MPTIQSKKYPDNIQFVTSETWQHFKRLGKDRNFKIIDDGDMVKTVIGTPEQIVEFSNTTELQPDTQVEKVLSREEIKAELDGLEVEYNTRASTDKLLELLKENQ